MSGKHRSRATSRQRSLEERSDYERHRFRHRQSMAVGAHYKASKRGFGSGRELEEWLEEDPEIAARLAIGEPSTRG